MELYGYAYTVTDLLDILQANDISKNATIRVESGEAHDTPEIYYDEGRLEVVIV